MQMVSSHNVCMRERKCIVSPPSSGQGLTLSCSSRVRTRSLSLERESTSSLSLLLSCLLLVSFSFNFWCSPCMTHLFFRSVLRSLVYSFTHSLIHSKLLLFRIRSQTRCIQMQLAVSRLVCLERFYTCSSISPRLLRVLSSGLHASNDGS